MSSIKITMLRLVAIVIGIAVLSSCSTRPSWCPFSKARDYTASSEIVTSTYAEPLNIYNAKQQVEAYYSSGGYEQAMNQVGEKAMDYLKSCKDTPGKLAIVFDIDETSLSNYPVELKMDFGFNPNIFNDFVMSEKGTVIKPSLALFDQAKAQNVAVFFISGRHENQREATVENLKSVGYYGWTQLILKPDDFKPSASMVDFKAPLRSKIEQDGYRIILNIGDQYSDLNGGYADKCFKYPNPFYYIP